MLRKEAWIAVVAALTIAGCGAGSGRDPVLARVGAEKITVSDVDAELKMRGVVSADPKVRQAALEQIVSRKLFAQEARRQRLSNNAQAQAIREATIESLEASLARAVIVSGVKKPTPQEVTAFVRARPDMFAQRTEYLVERLHAQAAVDASLVEALKPVHTLQAAEAVLTARKIPYRKTLERLDTLRTPPALATSLQKLPPGEPFVLPEATGFTVGLVRESRAVPIVGHNAEVIAGAVLLAERQTKALAERTRALHAEKVEYAAAAKADPAKPPADRPAVK